MRVDEIDATGELMRAAYGGDYRLDPAYLDEIADVRGRAETAQLWVAADQGSGAVLGSVTTPHPGRRLQRDSEADEMDLRLLGVAREARGRGIGELLVRHCAGLARARGVSRLVLHTASQMVAAQRLYERLGFERVRERERDFIAMGERRLLMVYALPV
jgi:ribosomal protein S18 acetylase RimI-like enzyme